jgi:predicted PurR-regulated permease PerM
VLPLPKWLMRRFGLKKGAAILLSVTLVGLFYLITTVFLVNAAYRMMDKLPAYQENLQRVYQRVEPFFAAHGMESPRLSIERMLSSDKLMELARAALPGVLSTVSNMLLIALLSVLFVAELSVEEAGQSRLVAGLTYYGQDVQQYIGVAAKSGVATALANLVLLAALGVDFPLVWAVLYFFLQFIPNLGVILALVTPTLLALLTMGWQKAVVVALGMFLTNLVSANVLNPYLMKKSVNVSFLEMMLSLIVWGALLGPAGTVVAIPLTLVLKRVVEKTSPEETTAAA